MSAAAGGAAAASAAAAAAEQQRRMCEEEEEMTPYTQEDLRQDWEFKILRSATGAFKHPQLLQQYLDEEARAGWVLVEKFDDARVRLKRPAAARERDGKLDIDPYRTYVGLSPNAVAWRAMGIVIGIIAAIMAAAIAIGLIANAFG